MVGSWRSPVMVVVVVSLVVAMVAASSMKAVAAAGTGEKPICKMKSDDIRDIVHSVVNPNNTAITNDCKKIVSRVKSTGSHCLCELLRTVRGWSKYPIERSPCITPADMAGCPPPCVISQGTVDQFAKEIKSKKSSFKQSTLCKNTVRDLMKAGDDCFCQLRSRVQKKVDFSIDGSLCAAPAIMSRCPRTGKEPPQKPATDAKNNTGCRISERDVFAVAEKVRVSTSAYNDELCRDAVSRVRSMGEDCLCQLRDLAQAHFDDIPVDRSWCVSPPEMPKCSPACVISEDTVSYVAKLVGSDNNAQRADICSGAVRNVMNMGKNCFCELRRRVQAKFDSSVDKFLCANSGYISQCPRTGKEEVCSTLEDDVQYCVDAELGFFGARVRNASPLVSSRSNRFELPTVSGCCSKVSKLESACACKFRQAIEQKLRAEAGLTIDMTRISSCKIGGEKCP